MWYLTKDLRQPASRIAKQIVSRSPWKPIRNEGNISSSWLPTSRQFFHRSRHTTSSSSHAGKGPSLMLSLGLAIGGCTTAYLMAQKMQKRDEGGTRSAELLLGLGSFSAACHEKLAEEKEDGARGISMQRFDSAIQKSRDFLQRAKDEVGSPGIVAAVSVDGQLVWSEGIGFADVENRTPCSPSSVMRIASISKSLTMTAVARLMEEDKLDLDKPVQEYVPSFPQKEWDGETVAITTRHLVSHLGGIRHYDKSYMKKKNEEKSGEEDNKEKEDAQKEKKKRPEKQPQSQGSSNEKGKTDKKVGGSSKDLTRVKSESDHSEVKSKREYTSVKSSLDMFKDDPLVHKPGSKYLYTTHGWTLVSAVVEAAWGQDYLACMRTILTDLDMKETVPDKHVPLIYNRSRGYSYNKNGRLENTPYVDNSYKWAGGGYLSTVGDLIKFGNAMLYSYQSSNQAEALPGYLKPETMQTIWKPIPKAKPKPTNQYSYAMGWTAVEKEQTHGQCQPNRHFVAHTGGAMGFSSILSIAPSLAESRNSAPKDESDLGQSGQNQANSVEKSSAVTTTDTAVSTRTALPKGVVVAIFVNLTDVGLSRTAEKIIEAFQEVAK